MAGRRGELAGAGQEGARWTRVGAWCAQGWRIYRVAPVRILLLALMPVVFEALVQSAPSAGIVLSKLLTPAVSAWVLVMLDCKLRRRGFLPWISGRQTALRWRQVAGLALASLLVFSVQVAMAALLGSPAQAVALAAGDIAGVGLSQLEMAGVLASGAAPMLFLFFVGPRMMLDGLRLWPAVVDNARLLKRYWQPMAFYSLAMALMLAGLTWMPLLLLVFLPAGLCIGYAAYRDVFDPLPEA